MLGTVCLGTVANAGAFPLSPSVPSDMCVCVCQEIDEEDVRSAVGLSPNSNVGRLTAVVQFPQDPLMVSLRSSTPFFSQRNEAKATGVSTFQQPNQGCHPVVVKDRAVGCDY